MSTREPGSTVRFTADLHDMRTFSLTALALFVLMLLGCATRTERETMPDPLADVTGEELFQRGLVVSARGDLIRAEQYFVAALDKQHPPEVVLPMLIRVCVASSRHSAALSHAQPYLRAHPSNWRLRLLVATLRLGLGDVEAARVDLHRVLQAAPEEATAYYMLGMLYREETHDEPRAREHFERYLQLAPEGQHAEEVRAALVAGPPPVMVNIERAEPEPTETAPSPEETQPETTEVVEGAT